jgi:hypothetical protein
LVLLNSKTIPPSILEEMFRTVEIHIKHQQLNIKQLTTADKVLEGTSYSKDDSSKMTSNTLDDIKDSDDYSFITDRNQKGKVF